jgi:hypothetical protein
VGSGTANGSGNFSFALSSNVTANASNSLVANATDSTGAVSACSSALTYVHDSVVPTVSSRTPGVSASNVAINTAITVVFSEAMNTSTLNTTNITVSGGVTGAVTTTSTSATFTPSALLANSVTYTVSLGTGIRDVAGNALAATSWSYTTAAPPTAPVLVSTTPVSPGNNLRPTVAGTAPTNTSVKVFLGGCGVGQVGSGTADGSGNFSIALTSDVTANASNSLVANATDSTGAVSACSSALTYVHDNVVPTVASRTPDSNATMCPQTAQ